MLQNNLSLHMKSNTPCEHLSGLLISNRFHNNNALILSHQASFIPVLPHGVFRCPFHKITIVREAVQRLCEEQDYNPFKVIIETAKDPETPLKVRLKIAIEVAQYLSPKLKSLDINSEAGKGVTIQIVKYGDSSPLPLTNDVDSELV